jgi:ribonucleoside-diphosphate reductase beta chain
MLHSTFTTITRGLQRNSPPMRLYEKAKRLGIWNPSEIDFQQDLHDWQSLDDLERDAILRLTTMFQAGEEAVTLDLLPLILVIAREERIEEEIFLTSFLFEEAKHTYFFRRFLDEVAGNPQDLTRYHTPNYQAIFYDALPRALQRLITDPSPAAQVEAAATYNLIVEGVLAETGYHAYFTALERNNLMPGVRQGIRLIKQDESRHIAYGIFLLSRLVAADEKLWPVLEETMARVFLPAVGVVNDAFACYETFPFGITQEEFVNYAMQQYQKRFERLEKARGASLEEVTRAALGIEEEDA